MKYHHVDGKIYKISIEADASETYAIIKNPI
jgi:hypothetical protein